mmetsp:Transcript_2992/g.6508  ORF Transcript_2992/g.6508 Transcript_2992/m.6508 type:complete len:423 (-) Transcript_2992:1317-2585(-)|eukprot:CAMPEP_0172317378 /NCGR_PEP_ID=MMETSP1058-20130122/31387_1 /TAXON_ID=83371 /ORGANISM="Detonula confervacea, Strain CCMP 353" /LENGTH=422 /DNA_ID=CAMNT_0013031919 /DNA_START=26 /DNA_END=1294 /DNA_ORIENTATION=+
MRVYSATVALVASPLLIPFSSGFMPSQVASSRVNSHGQLQHHNSLQHSRLSQVLYSTSTEESETTSPTANKKKKKKLGLITFDLDDTLYPIAPVLDEANAAFSTAMSNFGYVDIQPSDIVETGKEIRSQVSPDDDGCDPLKPATVNHKEIRMAAIRKEMEKFILMTKLRQTAEDWATEVDSLTAPVRKSAEKWARATVHSSVVQAVYNAWEMERHHAAERHLFPEAISTIKQIQADNPNVIIGAVTDGSANPMLMVFSLMPLFDFTISWEDNLDKVQHMEQFQELSAVDESDKLSWIYRLAREKGKEMSLLKDEIEKNNSEDSDEEFECVWVHVGDDLAYDVGGAATNGAKTVLVELAPEYGQTARLRFEGKRPSWTTETEEQVENHQKMSQNALDKVDAKITHLSQLPEVIKDLLKGEDDE